MNLARLCICLFILSSSATATDLYVLPGESIQAAIDGSASGDRIFVDAGTYHEVLNLHGKLIQVISTSGPATTIVDGTGFSDSVITAHSGEVSGTEVIGFTIQHGVGKTNQYGDTYGGGVFVLDNSSLRLRGCVIIDNGGSSTTFGGGVFTAWGRLELIECVLAGNSAFAAGSAGFVAWSGWMRLERCTVTKNLHEESGSLAYANAGHLTLNSAIVWGNSGQSIRLFSTAGGIPTVEVSYSNIDGGASGSTNIAVDPQFVAPASGDYSLSPGSPCIDSGDPALPADPDGTRADIGALPFDHYPIGTYCVAKVNSLGCMPAIAWSGSPNLSGPDDFHVTAANIASGTNGLLLWGATGEAAIPFHGGVLCISPPIIRTPIQFSGGSPPMTDCTGAFDFHFSHAYLDGYLVGPGMALYAQYYSRDNGFLPPDNVGLSDAIRFTVKP